MGFLLMRRLSRNRKRAGIPAAAVVQCFGAKSDILSLGYRFLETKIDRQLLVGELIWGKRTWRYD